MVYKLSIIILNWNGRDVTIKCLESLFQITDFDKIDCEVILIDNGSTDNSKECFKNYENKVHLILLEDNLRFIKGNNLGIEYTLKTHNPDYILLLNNDTEIIESDWLKKLLKSASTEDIAIVGPKLVFPNGRIQWTARKREKNPIMLILQTITARMNPGFGEFEENAPYTSFVDYVNTISGACMLIKTEFIRKYGLLDTTLYPMYQEDVEYSLRAWKEGYKVLFRGDVKLIHYEGYGIESSLNNNLEKQKFYWAMRNSMKVSKRYFGNINLVLFGLPIYLFVTLFDKKNKDKELTITNFRLTRDLTCRFKLFFKALKNI